MNKTANALLDVMREWIGYSESNGKFKEIIDIYNSVKPLPRNYRVQYIDEWCATTISAAGIKSGMSDLVGLECSCNQLISQYISMGIWIENGSITPIPGDIILYNWDSTQQPNDGSADHIGVVESVTSGSITVIEGNKNTSVSRRIILIADKTIRGFSRPKYESEVNTVNMTKEKAKAIVKEKAKLSDETIQYIVECYRWGDELIIKLAGAMYESK